MTSAPPRPGSAEPRQRLGTFAGVFTPSILTILGIILFLRLGYVVGQAGLGQALLIIAIANGISVLTSISLSAIATNLRVKAGGDYYVISRTLGVRFGGALGIVLFLSQAISIAFYAIGFAEAITALVAEPPAWLPRAIAALAVTGLFVLSWLGADWATRFQYVVMAVLGAALVAFFAGAAGLWDPGRLELNLAREGAVPFWAIFAIFFPAVTGFTQGVSMSGDLEDPGRSIPRGTFLAVGLSSLVYFAVAIAFAGSMSLYTLATDYSAMRTVAAWSWLADAGVVAATLSSALASFLGAPRILQSLAKDRLFPGLGFLAKGYGPMDNPRRGVVVSAAIAYGTIALGDLNLVAPVVSMFFLISYGLLNYATYFEARGRSPFFRPRFRWFHKNLSLLGAIACLFVMLMLNAVAAVAAGAILYGIYQYLKRSVTHARWADSGRSIRFQVVRDSLLGIREQREHPRDWRPVILAFSSNFARRERVLRFGDWLAGESGMTTAVQILEGRGATMRKKRQEADAALRAEIKAHELDAFSLVVSAESLGTALPVLLQSHGIGPIRANTVLLNWFDGPEGPAGDDGLRSYARYLQTALSLGCNVVILAATPEELAGIGALRRDERSIALLYLGDATSRLMLLFAYLMTRTDDWGQATIRLLAPVAEGRDAAATLAELEAMLEDVRIDAEIEVMERLTQDALVERARSATVVLVPFHFRGEEIVGPLRGDVQRLIEHLPMTALVLAARDVALDAEPEAGRHGEIAEALDVAERARRAVRVVERTTQEAHEGMRRAREAIGAARTAGADAEEIARLDRALTDAQVGVERANRRVLKAKVKAESATSEARRLVEDPDGAGSGG